MNAPSKNNDKRIAITVAVLFHVVIIGFFWLSSNSSNSVAPAKKELPIASEKTAKEKAKPATPTQEKNVNATIPILGKESLHRIDKAKQLLK